MLLIICSFFYVFQGSFFLLSVFFFFFFSFSFSNTIIYYTNNNVCYFFNVILSSNYQLWCIIHISLFISCFISFSKRLSAHRHFGASRIYFSHSLFFRHKSIIFTIFTFRCRYFLFRYL